MEQGNKSVYTLLFIIILITIFNLSLVYFVFNFRDTTNPDTPKFGDFLPDWGDDADGVTTFASAEDFKEYLSKSPEEQYYGGGVRTFVAPQTRSLDIGLDVSESIGLGSSDGAVPVAAPDRVSDTNVQVMGIDEPDIVKTDGQEIYFSSPSFFMNIEPRSRILEEGFISDEPGRPDRFVPQRRVAVTKSINAWPPADLKIDAEIEKNGNLLLVDDMLVVLTNGDITGFDVSDPTNPNEKWVVELEDGNSLETARLYDDKIYLVTRTRINRPQPCPIKPLVSNGQTVEIACTDIYHPEVNVPVNSTYSLLLLDPKTGEIKNKTAFVGTTGQSVVYMSTDSVYITYYYQGDLIAYMLNFFQENSDLVPDWFVGKLAKLQTYDLSPQSKMTELGVIFEEWESSLNNDDRLKLENEFENRVEDYASEHSRDLVKTGIAKIDINKFEVTASGNVPGTTLNQFSLDEYKGNLRIATTTGNNRFIPFVGGGDTVNDVYVLDKNLKEIGAVLDLGITETIHSARFIEDKGYVVTFRRVDPFYVIDLSNPKKPKMTGELKIPGFSSYLHPINKDKILGVGEEDGKVKLSLFDVSNPADPKEISKYNLSERYSEIQNTHHAFLLDDKHKVFFLPGSQGGYIFDYTGDELKLERAISDIRARRAIYLDDYMYIIGDDRIVILNESDWQEVNDLDF